MKRLFNRTKRPQQEWEGYDESEYDWDSVTENADNDGYYEDGDGGAYYADPEFDGEGEAYYGTEADSLEEEAGYYADEEGFAEEGPGYYAEGDGFAEEEAGYYMEEGGFEEEEAGYYADEEGFAEDEAGYYADEEGFADEDEYLKKRSHSSGSVSSRNPSVRRDGRENSFWIKLQKGAAGMSVLDRVILGTGVAVLIMALLTGSLYISRRMVNGQISDFVSVGSQLNGIDTIGEAGLLAVADAQLAKMAAASVVADEKDEENRKDYDEQEYTREVQVGMELTSIQKDLKIKFVNKKTGKLISNVPFAVNVTDPDGKNFVWSDDDMDGIIYKKDITPGSYKLAMEALTDSKYSDYIISTASATATVKKDIEYKKVDVDNEVKTEDEVDVSKEDTKVNETKVESALTDTVAWVESTKTPASYIEVPKSSITDPKVLLSQALGKAFQRATVSGNDPSPEPSGEPPANPTEEPSPSPEVHELKVSLTPATASVEVGKTNTFTPRITVTLDGKSVENATSAALNVISPTDGCAAVSIDNSGKITVTGMKEGTATYKIQATIDTVATGQISAAADLTVTVTPAKSMTLDKTELTLFVGDDPVSIKATVTNAGADVPTVTAVSSDGSILKVVKCEKNVVTVEGLKASDQVVTVTVTLQGSDVSAKCLVKVKANPKDDKTTLLKDSKGQQLYVKVDDKTYREAVYADFYDDNVKLYLMGEVKYTGWQTIDNKVYYFTADGKAVTGEQVIQGAKYNFASDGSLVTGNGALGIDVSKWNGKIDWNAVKNSGVNYVIIRCGYRGSSAGSLIEDPNFVTNIKGATSAGLKVGVYFFTQAIDEREAVEEASMVLSQIKNYKISYPVFLDVESSGGRADSISNATRTAVCKAFCETIKNAGYNAGVYANKNWWETKINASELNAYKIWLAQYASAPTYTGRYDLWQYRSTGKVSGISGNVDMNLSYLGY